MREDLFYRKMLDNFYEGVYFVDNKRKITFWNTGAERITGFSPEEVLGKSCFDNILNHVDEAGRALCLEGCPLEKTLADGLNRESGVYLHHKDGQRVKIFIRTTPIYEEEEIIGAVEVFVDDSERANLATTLEELKVLAMYDQLTGLPNRRYIDSQLKNQMNQYRTLNIPFGIAFMDIDHFKHFNDTYGHHIGDQVLQMVSKTYISCVRRGDLVGRWGGEEFIVLLNGINTEGLEMVTEKIRMLVEKSSIRENDQVLSVTVSIGATQVKPEDSIESMIKRADTLMYESKEGGRNQVTIG